MSLADTIATGLVIYGGALLFLLGVAHAGSSIAARIRDVRSRR